MTGAGGHGGSTQPNRCAALIAISAAFAFVLACLGGCGGGGKPTDGGNTATALERIQRNIFTPSCALSPCHSAAGRKGDMILTDAATSFAQLVNVSASNSVANAAGKRRVVPFFPDSSFLITKLTNPGPGEGTRMPDANPALQPDTIQIIRDWIAAGAPRN